MTAQGPATPEQYGMICHYETVCLQPRGYHRSDGGVLVNHPFMTREDVAALAAPLMHFSNGAVYVGGVRTLAYSQCGEEFPGDGPATDDVDAVTCLKCLREGLKAWMDVND